MHDTPIAEIGCMYHVPALNFDIVSRRSLDLKYGEWKIDEMSTTNLCSELSVFQKSYTGNFIAVTHT